MKIEPAKALDLCSLGSRSTDRDLAYVFEEWAAIVMEEKSIWIFFAFLTLFLLMTAPTFL